MRRALAGRILCWTNQVPGLYHGRPSYPAAQIAGCKDGSGGGNVRHFLVDPDGRITGSFKGYWRPGPFLERWSAGGEPDSGPIRERLERIAAEVYTEGRTG